MLWMCMGTAGELIKIYPLIWHATKRKIPWKVVATGQSGVVFWKQWDDFGLPRENAVRLLETDRDLGSAGQALGWFSQAMTLSRKVLQKKLTTAFGKGPATGDYWVVHGDTLSTLLGAIYSRRLGIPLAHVEAGLRSPSLLRPFPEELNRRMVSRMTQIHFPQDDLAERNLKSARVKGEILCTGANTLLDALRLVLQEESDSKVALPKGKFCVANLHRFENLGSAKKWEFLIETLVKASRLLPVYLVLHAPTQAKLAEDPSARERLEKAGVHLLPRMPFVAFAHWLAQAQYVISDGGSNQEECSYLGKPCLILRGETERQEGLHGGSCLLSRFDSSEVERFLKSPESFERPKASLEIRPSEMILDRLVGSA